MAISVRPIKAELTRSLRQQILRPMQTLEEMKWPRDDDQKTLHLGAWADDRLVGIVTLYPQPMPMDPQRPQTWQLRGMAVDSQFQGQGIGKLLVKEAISQLQYRGVQTLWCDARVSACEFYKSMKFVVISKPYEKPPVGPHVLMKLDLGTL